MMNRPILVVEDDPDDRYFIQSTLRKAKVYNPIVMLETGQAALDLCQHIANGSYTDALPILIILDINLGDISGMEVLRSIRSTEVIKDCRVLVLTGQTEFASSINTKDLQPVFTLNKDSRIALDIRRFFEAGRELGVGWILTTEPEDRKL